MDIGLLLLRLTVSVLMAPHGWGKFIDFAERAHKFPDPLGIGSPLSMGFVVFAELFCSIFLFAGLFTRFALIPLMITMGFAVFVIHVDDPFGDKEHALLFLVPYVGLFFTGPGAFSLDRRLRK